MLIQSCQRKGDDIIDQSVKEYRASNVKYGSNSRHIMDVALPANRDNNTPFVILIHGGSWVSGDKQDLKLIQDSLMKNGMGSVSINYRYASSSVHFESLMEDVESAVEFCYLNREDWKIRADKYVLVGVSAGAHMALLYGYKYDKNNRVGAIVSGCGPTNAASIDWLNYLALFGQLTTVEQMVGATYTLGQPLNTRFSQASPLNNISNKPTLLFHGTLDLLVPYEQAVALKNELNAEAISNKLIAFEGAGHDLGISNPSNLKTIITEAVSWCNAYGR